MCLSYFEDNAVLEQKRLDIDHWRERFYRELVLILLFWPGLKIFGFQGLPCCRLSC